MTTITNTSVTTSDLTVDTNTIKVDSTNNRVGIGTTSPTQALEVAGNIYVNTSGNPYLAVRSTGAGNNPFVRIQADTNYWDLQSLFSNTNDELDFRYNGSSKMMMTKDGYVTMPNQPRFYSKNMNFPYQTGGFGVGGTVDVNNGNVYDSSNGRFTAPVAGTYTFHMMTQYYDGATGSYITAKFYKNGVFQSLESYSGYGHSSHAQAPLTQMMILASGDYINAFTDFGARDIQNFFSGYLIG